MGWLRLSLAEAETEKTPFVPDLQGIYFPESTISSVQRACSVQYN